MNATIANPLYFLNDAEAIKAVIDCFLTNIYKFFLSSYGIGGIAIIMICTVLFSAILKRIKDREIPEMTSDEYKIIFLVLTFGVALLIVIAGLAVKGGLTIPEGYKLKQETKGYKHFFYVRYYLPFIGPILAGTYAWCLKHIQVTKKWFKTSVLLILLIFLYISCKVFPQLIDTQYLGDRTSLSPIMIKLWNVSGLKDNIFNICVSFFILLIMLFLITHIIATRKEIFLWLGICFLITAQGLANWGNNSWKITCETASFTYAFIKEVEERVEIPRKIYCLGDIFTMQFALSRYSIVADFPREEEAVLVTNYKLESIEEWDLMDMWYKKLDNNEYVYIRGNELVEDLMDEEFEFIWCGEGYNG